MEAAEELPQRENPPNGPAGPSRLLTVFVGLLVLATVFSVAFTPLRASQDEWWHLKTGQWIVEHRALPENDIFTYTGETRRWYNHEWLSQVIFYLVYSAGAAGATGALAEIGGVTALVTFKALVVTATFALLAWLARLRSGSWAAALLVTLVAADISRRTIYPRPPIFSYLFFAGFLALLSSWKLGRLRFRWLWLLVPATVVWANLHGMVLLAIVAVGAFAGGDFLEAILRKQRKSEVPYIDQRVRGFLLLSVLTVLVFLAALAQPSGVHLFFLSRNFTADPFLQQVISEMLPPPALFTWEVWWNPATWEMGRLLSLSFWVTVPVLLLLLAANRFRLPFGADYLLTGFFLYQAVNHWRLLPLFALAAAGPLAYLVARLVRRLRPRAAVSAEYGLLVATALLAGVFVFAVREPVSFARRNLELLRGNVMDPASYPRPLMDFLIRARLPDRMMSEVNYCGYAIWRLAPEHHKLFTDNRFDLFGSIFAIPEWQVFQGIEVGDRFHGKPVTAGWSEILDRHGVNFVVVSRGPDREYINRALRRSPEWKHIYYYAPPGVSPLYGGFSVYLRNKPEFADAAERAASIFSRMHPGNPPPQELDRILEEMRTRERAARRAEPGSSAAPTDPTASLTTTALAQENH